jgi:hypothetical protein
MGDLTHPGLGWGIQIGDTENVEKYFGHMDKNPDYLDINAWIEDHYPLLVENPGGNMWSEAITFITVKSMSFITYDYISDFDLNEIGKDNIEGKRELQKFMNDFNISLKPQWYIWAYVG